MTRKKRGKQRIGQNGAPPFSTGTTFPKTPNAFVEAWMWAIFAAHEIEHTRALVLARESGACIVPFQQRAYGSVVDSLHGACANKLFRLRRLVCCAAEESTAPFTTLSSIVTSHAHRRVHVYVHESDVVDVVVRVGQAVFSCMTISASGSFGTPRSFATSESVYAHIRASSETPWVYICDIKV
jgi:hypothetical protein